MLPGSANIEKAKNHGGNPEKEEKSAGGKGEKFVTPVENAR